MAKGRIGRRQLTDAMGDGGMHARCDKDNLTSGLFINPFFFMHTRYGNVQGIIPFGFTGGEISSFSTWPVNSSNSCTRWNLMGGNIVNLSHIEKDLMDVNWLWNR